MGLLVKGLGTLKIYGSITEPRDATRSETVRVEMPRAVNFGNKALCKIPAEALKIFGTIKFCIVPEGGKQMVVIQNRSSVDLA